MKIYYSVSLGNSLSKKIIGAQIAHLDKYGFVQTAHLEFDSELDVSVSDSEIYQLEMDLLQKSDVVIVECTVESLNAGYIIAKAQYWKKPILCVYFSESQAQSKYQCSDGKISALIKGCANVSIGNYHNIDEFELIVRKFLVTNTKTHRIILLGSPKSGKSTIGHALCNEFGMVHVSTQQILRDLTSGKPTHPHAVSMKQLMAKEELVPSHTMKDIVFKRLSEPDCINEGFLLDTYPSSYEDLCNLIPTFVFYLECSDETSIERQWVQHKAMKRSKNFHQEMPDYQTICNKWFKNILVVQINADNDANVVYDSIKQILLMFEINRPRLESPCVPIKLCKYAKCNSKKFQFTISTNNSNDIFPLIKNIYAYCCQLIGQIKVYPVQPLCLENQIIEYDKAFIIGRMGDDLDINTIISVLTAIKNTLIRGQNISVRLEEHIDECMRFTYTKTKFIKYTKSSASQKINNCDPKYIDMNKFLEFDNHCTKHKSLELYLAFDLSKEKYHNQPIDLHWLNKKCTKKAFPGGHWFIIKDDNDWFYRFNKGIISNLNSTNGTKIDAWAKKLSLIIHAKLPSEFIELKYGLKVIHGEWIF